jgi:hypothetical protein
MYRRCTASSIWPPPSIPEPESGLGLSTRPSTLNPSPVTRSLKRTSCTDKASDLCGSDTLDRAQSVPRYLSSSSRTSPILAVHCTTNPSKFLSFFHKSSRNYSHSMPVAFPHMLVKISYHSAQSLLCIVNFAVALSPINFTINGLVIFIRSIIVLFLLPFAL